MAQEMIAMITLEVDSIGMSTSIFLKLQAIAAIYGSKGAAMFALVSRAFRVDTAEAAPLKLMALSIVFDISR